MVQDPPHGGSGHRDVGPAQGVPDPSRRAASGRPEPRPRGPGGRGARLPRTQRVGQDHDHPDAARPGPPHQGHDGALRAGRPPAPPGGDRPGRRRGRVAEVLAELHRPPEPRLLAATIGAPRTRVDAALETVEPHRARPGPLQGLLARHEAAARDRGHAAQGPRPADPGRADQRPRPGRHPRDPRHHPRPRQRRRDRAAQLPHPRRGPAGVHLRHDHRQRPAAGQRQGRRPARRQYDVPRRRARPTGRAAACSRRAGLR